MSTVTLPVFYENGFPGERLPVVSGGTSVVECAAERDAVGLSRTCLAGRSRGPWHGAYPCHETSETGLSAYASVTRMGSYYKGMIVDCKI